MLWTYLNELKAINWPKTGTTQILRNQSVCKYENMPTIKCTRFYMYTILLAVALNYGRRKKSFGASVFVGKKIINVALSKTYIFHIQTWNDSRFYVEPDVRHERI